MLKNINYDNFNGKTIKNVELKENEVTKQAVVIHFTDGTKMKIDIEARGNGWDFEELCVDIIEE